MLTALHIGIAWRFKFLSLSGPPTPPCTTPPSSLSTCQSAICSCHPRPLSFPSSLPPSPQEHVVFKLRLYLTCSHSEHTEVFLAAACGRKKLRLGHTQVGSSRVRFFAHFTPECHAGHNIWKLRVLIIMIICDYRFLYMSVECHSAGVLSVS